MTDLSAPNVLTSLVVEDATIALTLAQDAAPAGRPAGEPVPGWMGVVPYIFIGVVFYLLIFRPAGREKAERQRMLAELQKSDEVVTAGGLVGIVSQTPADESNDVLIKVDGTRLKVRRDSIREVVPRSSKGSRDDKDSDDAS